MYLRIAEVLIKLSQETHALEAARCQFEYDLRHQFKLGIV